MYKHLGIDDWLFVALYGAVAMMARLRMTDEKTRNDSPQGDDINKRSLTY